MLVAHCDHRSVEVELSAGAALCICTTSYQERGKTDPHLANRREAGDLRVFPLVSARQGSLPRAERGARV